jgi:hypothetical protein
MMSNFEQHKNNLRGFYITFPIRDAVRHELTWTQYRQILSVKNEQALMNKLQRFLLELGQNFITTNFKYTQPFYIAFSKGHSVRDLLPWTHYRMIFEVEFGFLNARAEAKA